MEKNHRPSSSLAILVIASSFFAISFMSRASIITPLGGSPGTTITSMIVTTGRASSLIVAPASLNVTVLGTQVTVQWSQSIGQAELTVEDQTGQVVVDDVVNTQSTSSYTIDMTGFDSGTYTVILKSSTKQVTQDFTLN
jgi:hypothetical protein